jgi:hypothetical protein
MRPHDKPCPSCRAQNSWDALVQLYDELARRLDGLAGSGHHDWVWRSFVKRSCREEDALSEQVEVGAAAASEASGSAVKAA